MLLFALTLCVSSLSILSLTLPLTLAVSFARPLSSSLAWSLAASVTAGIAKSATDHRGVAATHMQTQNVAGTQIYMSPEYKNGLLSTKVDAFAFGLVVLEALTGYDICKPVPGYSDLHSLYEEELGSADKLLVHLDKRASWEVHLAERVAALFSIADRCLEPRRQRRPEIVSIINELEEVRRGAEAVASSACMTDRRECVVCMESDVAGWVMLRPCGHVCVCSLCCAGQSACPLCRQPFSESLPVFL